MQVTSPDTLEKKGYFAGTGREATAILFLCDRGMRSNKKGVAPYTECCCLNSLYLTLVAELNDTIFFYLRYLRINTVRGRKMQIWMMATSLDKPEWAPIVFLSLEGKVREAILELDTAVLNSEDGMKNLYKKLDTLFLEDINQSAFWSYETFEGYRRPPVTSLEDFLIGRHVTKLKDFNILLPEPVLAFRALKSANHTLDNEKLVKATDGKLTLSSMSGQLRKIMHKHSSDTSSPNTSPVMVKNEVDIINNAENNQMDPTEVYYGCSLYRGGSRFNSCQRKINCGGRRQGNKNKTRSTDKKKLNPLDPAGNTTVCFNCGCKFHWSYDCRYVDRSRDEHGSENEKDLSVTHVVLMSQQKR